MKGDGKPKAKIKPYPGAISPSPVINTKSKIQFVLTFPSKNLGNTATSSGYWMQLQLTEGRKKKFLNLNKNLHYEM